MIVNITIVILFLLLAYAPYILLVVSGSALIIISTVKYKQGNENYFIIFATLYALSIIIYTLSVPNFLVSSDDFTTYYNNYVGMISGDFYNSISEFGFEIGLPILNYFLSIFSNLQYPYIFKLYHSVLNFIILSILLVYVRKNTSMSVKEFFVFSCFILILFKLPQQLHLMRQGYASYFILFALFSKYRYQRCLFLSVASIFHLSALIIYPFFFFLTKVNSKKQFYFFIIVFFSFLVLLSVLVSSGIFFDIPLVNKLNFIIGYIDSEEHVNRTLSEVLKALMYFYPLAFFSIIYWFKSIKCDESYFVYLSILFLLIFSVIPGFGLRVYMPYMSIFLGYYYYKYFCERGFSVLVFMFIFLFLILNINWLVNSELFFYNYPTFSSEPFYYIDSWMKEVGEVCRECLPYNYNFDNKFK
ncbi:EpsG family protein [Vibrio cholerae]|uniref:EpsG family protein n=1 Tax=Vibrio cholerae TaxID=666 RepID=UPI0018F0F3BF|nr:EpsG family protein [Vibrio cholerae]MBJ6944628.1 EpsG family protein [Vibrio cholerae]